MLIPMPLTGINNDLAMPLHDGTATLLNYSQSTAVDISMDQRSALGLEGAGFASAHSLYHGDELSATMPAHTPTDDDETQNSQGKWYAVTFGTSLT